MHIYFITGTSRGIGAAIAHELISPEHVLICLSRGGNLALREEAFRQRCQLQDPQVDLSNTETLFPWIKNHLKNLDTSQLSAITLINNAGALRPVLPIGHDPRASEITNGVAVNLLAPMLLTELFVSQTQEWTVPKKILNISSGAARRPVASWSMYCSTKAAMDMHSRCLAEEQKLQAYPIQVVSLAPGTVDTAMQDHLRQKTKDVFPGVQRFLDLKKEGKLWSTSYVAEEIVKFMADPDFGKEVLMDLRQWVKND